MFAITPCREFGFSLKARCPPVGGSVFPAGTLQVKLRDVVLWNGIRLRTSALPPSGAKIGRFRHQGRPVVTRNCRRWRIASRGFIIILRSDVFVSGSRPLVPF